MTLTLNKVCLIGRVGQKPEIRTMQNGKEVASFDIATSDSWIDRKTKERRSKTRWHKISVLSDGLIKVIKEYVDCGSKVYIEGSLDTTKWSDDKGVERVITRVVLQGYHAILILLDTKDLVMEKE